MGGLTQTEVYVSMGNLNGDLNLRGPAIISSFGINVEIKILMVANYLNCYLEAFKQLVYVFSDVFAYVSSL
jgi:hypothetical protein